MVLVYVSAETAKELIKVEQQVNGMMGGGGYSSGGNAGGSTVTCGMCNGTGSYHWPGLDRATLQVIAIRNGPIVQTVVK